MKKSLLFAPLALGMLLGLAPLALAQTDTSTPPPLPTFITPSAPSAQAPSDTCLNGTGPCATGSNSSSGSSGSGFTSPNLGGLTTLANTAIGFINFVLAPLLIAIAFITFLYGVASAYIFNGANEERRTEGHKFILWSIIGFVVIFSVWGLVNLVQGSLGLIGNQAAPHYPTL